MAFLLELNGSQLYGFRFKRCLVLHLETVGS